LKIENCPQPPYTIPQSTINNPQSPF